MSQSRCFENMNNAIVTSSDRIHSLRQKTIYLEIKNNATKHTPNPLKKNSARYNSNFNTKRMMTEDSSNNYFLSSAKNHTLLLDITKGKRFSNPIKNIGSNRYKIWGGNVMQINYKDKIPSKIFTFTQPSDVVATPLDHTVLNNNIVSEIIDPGNNILHSRCLSNTNSVSTWIKNVVSSHPIHKNTHYYLKGTHADPLKGMSYPEKINFKHQSACTQEDTACLNHPNCLQ